jgi:serine protease DegQ
MPAVNQHLFTADQTPGTENGRQRMKTMSRARLIVATATALVLAAGLTACGTESSSPATAAPAASSPAVTGQPDSFARIPQIVQKAQPSIVTVIASQTAAAGAYSEGVGSGVIYRSDGVILTNNHVVAGATRLEVAFADGSRSVGRVTATDPDTDLAVIRVERTGLPAAHFRTALPPVGSLAIVLGSPLGFEKTVTAGIVSGVHRQIPGSASGTRALVDLLQTDAAISPGNSGGAVVDADGRVTGISIAYIPPQQGAVAVGFAIPAATATRVADELLQNGRARHAYLGLQPGELTAQIASEMHVKSDGVLVYALAPNGPAAQAGLRPGDVVTAIGSEKVTSVEELFAALRGRQPGETVAVSYVRDGQERTGQVQVSDRPA